MRKARIGETSLYYAYFGEGVNIRRENIADGGCSSRTSTPTGSF